mmetsp:Transcript_53730/g.114135  ORF Transcript_53730/g.114135 Transcript_53730/m.114135 type:complete len:247 (+) Transcript_53730:110-850(+)|eukprot:CAMPEP_0172551572 /NCGR_PEP_ID=MMETSP1067-20121228/40081_1 /TAXON_ID=265564 ORGANISM="Thalassiosira punctigera, Strain Tpunct2005C2" /NCGR_SAMPLE_ID=MMETSP1067 /ASSEMBLY_ACC=CAM_ASM_000444 /LENGTH=246 /DNA_ID=CAMNT_0013339377 /DNA_START=109 /DNA_END=849 /DNA_ORIENTATION=+
MAQSIPTKSWRLALVLLLLPSASIKASAFARPPTNAIRLQPLYSSNSNDDTNNLLEKARKLREEVSAIESTKLEVQKEKDAKEQARQAAEREAQAQRGKLRMRYSAEVPILKDMGEEVIERVDFPPRLKGGKSRIVALQAALPLGLVLGQEDSMPGLTSVDEVAPGGNGAIAQIKQGDIVRAITACQTTMETPTWQLLAGGIGQPKTKRFMYSVDGRPLEEVLDAIGSNRMDVKGRDVWLVLERMD